MSRLFAQESQQSVSYFIEGQVRSILQTLTRPVHEGSTEDAHESGRLVNYTGMSEGDRQRKAHDDSSTGKPIAEIDVCTVIVCAEVVLASASGTESIWERCEDKSESHEKREPICVQCA